MTTKRLGKISAATFGFCGGYQDAMIGLAVTLEFDGLGICDFRGMWATAPMKDARWAEQDQSAEMASTVRFVRDTLLAAKKKHVGQLVGCPAEIETEDGVLVSWRVLTEVL